MIKKMLVKFFETYCRIVLSSYAPVKVFGKENLPNEPYLIYSNHNSHLDYIILSVFSSLGFQKTCVLVAKDYWHDNRLRRWFSNVFFNAIPVDRNRLFRTESIADMIKSCQITIDEGGSNRSLVIFPEGKRSKDGELQNFKTGPAAIASELNLMVVPAFISGTHEVWPKGRIFMKPGKINLIFGKPIKLQSDHRRKLNGLKEIKSDTEILQQTLLALKESFEAEHASSFKKILENINQE